MKTNKVTITGFSIGIIVLTFNIAFDIYLVVNDIINSREDNIGFLTQYNIDVRVLIAFICLSILALIGFIVCFVFLKGKIGARIAGALLIITLMFFTWIWIVGPVFCLTVGLILFNGREKVTNITLIEDHNLRQLKKQLRRKKSLINNFN